MTHRICEFLEQARELELGRIDKGPALTSRWTPLRPERARLNAVNSRLMNSLGEIRLMVDPNRAPMVAEDFDSVCLLEGGSGELDKDATPKYTHWTDGLGYYIADRYPITGPRESISVGGFS